MRKLKYYDEYEIKFKHNQKEYIIINECTNEIVIDVSSIMVHSIGADIGIIMDGFDCKAQQNARKSVFVIDDDVICSE